MQSNPSPGKAMPFVAVGKTLADIFVADTVGSSVVWTGMNSAGQKTNQVLHQRLIHSLTSMETPSTTAKALPERLRLYALPQEVHGLQLVTNP